MSRLYIEHTSDMGKGAAHRASERATASISWGSRDNSKLAAMIEVIWEKGKDKPEVFIINRSKTNEKD
jgi:hypothetical protein